MYCSKCQTYMRNKHWRDKPSGVVRFSIKEQAAGRERHCATCESELQGYRVKRTATSRQRQEKLSRAHWERTHAPRLVKKSG